MTTVRVVDVVEPKAVGYYIVSTKDRPLRRSMVMLMADGMVRIFGSDHMYFQSYFIWHAQVIL